MIDDRTWLTHLVQNVRGEVAVLRELLSTRNGVIQSIIEDLCALLGPSFRSLTENFHVSLTKSVNEDFPVAFIASQFYVNTVRDDITFRFSKGTWSEDGDGLTKSEDVVGPLADCEVIKLLWCSLFGLSW